MRAESLTRALGGTWHGHGGLAPCPVPGHGKGLGDRHPSLSISKGARQPIVVHCHAGCNQAQVIDALKDMGVWHGSAPQALPATPAQASGGQDPRTRLAFRIWSRAQPLRGSLAEAYLFGRRLNTDSPALRFLPHSAWSDIPATADGALVAALRGHGGEVQAVQLTYLTSEGSKANARPVRQTFGAMAMSAVQLEKAGPVLGLAEGTETALSARLLHGVPVWAVCGARLTDAPVPCSVQEIILFADHDPPGLAAAERALKAYSARGFAVSIRAPEMPGQDWNDVLLARMVVQP